MVRHWIVMTMRTRDSDGCFNIDVCWIATLYNDLFLIEWIGDKSHPPEYSYDVKFI
jgi:hypothetical protein